jgi:glucan 1,3-beta-glucosidase
MDAFETKSQEWVWWNFKTEGAREWNFFDAGLFPQPLTEWWYPPASAKYS